MAIKQKLTEILILSLVWVPVAAVSVFLVDKVEEISGHEWGVYGILAVLVALAWAGTEFALESVRVDTSYAPD